jgi:hypothetical protein
MKITPESPSAEYARLHAEREALQEDSSSSYQTLAGRSRRIDGRLAELAAPSSAHNGKPSS